MTEKSRFTEDMQALMDEFALFDDWEDRYAYLIDLGKRLPPLPEEEKTPDNKVSGCTSQVWLVADKPTEEPDHLHFRAESDAHIVKGLIAILLRIYSGKTSQEIRQIDIAPFFKEIGLDRHLSPNRSNGFFAMVERIQQLASNAPAAHSS